MPTRYLTNTDEETIRRALLREKRRLERETLKDPNQARNLARVNQALAAVSDEEEEEEELIREGRWAA